MLYLYVLCTLTCKQKIGANMFENQPVDVVIRSFKANIGYQKPKIDQRAFDKYRQSLMESVSNALSCSQVRTVYVVTNGDHDSPLAESVYPDGSTTTTKIVLQNFARQKVVALVCQDWGLNPGSCNAINTAIQAISQNESEPRWLLVLSKEMEMNPGYLHEALRAANEYNLFACGFFRQNHFDRAQWGIAQNTACLWDWDILREIGGFDDRCDGRPDEFLTIDGQKILLAGMDDFYAQLKIMKKYNFSIRWGMVLNEYPLIWNLSAKSLDEMRRHDEKVARQEEVMKRWAAEIFPDSAYRTVINRFFSKRKVL